MFSKISNTDFLVWAQLEDHLEWYLCINIFKITNFNRPFKDGFVKIEYDYVINTAKLAYEMGCKRFSVVSGNLANKDSYFFYLRTKVCTCMLFCPFHIPQQSFRVLLIFMYPKYHLIKSLQLNQGRTISKFIQFMYISKQFIFLINLNIYRLLLSKRNNDRLVEWIAAFLLKPIIWAYPTYITIPTTKVAKAIIFNMCADPIGRRTDYLPNAKLHHISDNFYDKMFSK